MGQLLSHPLTEKTIIYNDYEHLSQQASRRRSSEHSSSANKHRAQKGAQFFNCVGSMQGYRLTQEDAHLVANCDSMMELNFYNPFTDREEMLSMSVFGVFDGHGGDECSKYVSSENDAYQGIRKWIRLSFETHEYGPVKGLESKSFKRRFRTIEGLVSQVLKDAFLLQDRELYCHYANSSCGSTGILAVIINEKKLYVANTGDSRCVLSTKGRGVKTLSYDHKPQHIGELVRINDDGGTVSLGRVGGVLALSRAFGDFQFKTSVSYTNSAHGPAAAQRYVAPAQESQVTVEPDVICHQISYDRDEFLVLACDGIWDLYSNRNLVQFIKYHLMLGQKLDDIVTKLLDHGINSADSNTGVGFDNMTIIIIALNKQGETLAHWYGKMKSRLEREKGLTI
ncbi:type 2C protein phosphatase PTC4 [Lachancea thermotolerans CBS 6340]|uniref:protein-serine/threonine phosphatase n=1 Tax=Lachancea thermotolerans (strain ATCC 56472 / CBS 6340 / NRRL Y-8284) TaxID=559295 RepID=C5DLB3_LACTC|nr:KLTH0F11572p [Lachancea thermotolerans CBS 6340]CAR24264.1 KLTH0F11572p [Lachancea thermotolerans CBS 6340]